MHVLLFVLHVYAARLLGCEGEGNAGVGSGGGVVVVSAYMGGTRCSGVLASACDVLEMSVVRGVGGVCDMCMCLARGEVGGVGGDWVWALPILEEHVESGICVCVLVAVVWVVFGESGWALEPGYGRMGWCKCDCSNGVLHLQPHML